MNRKLAILSAAVAIALLPFAASGMTVALHGETLVVGDSLDGGHAIRYEFRRCMANHLYTFSKVEFDGSVVNEATSDNIGPFLIRGKGWTGGNHLAADESVINWLQKVIGTDGKGKKFKKNLDLIEEMYDCRVCIEWRPTSTLGVYIGKHLGCGIVNSKPDGYGFFTREADWDNSTELCCLCNDYNIPSLYRGNL